MKRSILSCLALVLLMAAGSMVSAADSSWIVRANYVVTWPSTDSYQTESVIGEDSIFSELSLDKGQGFGLDIPFGDSPFMATLAVKYLISDLKEDGGPREIAIDPIIGAIGIGLHF